MEKDENKVEQLVKSEIIPLLYVDVNIGGGKTERIIIYEGDKPEELAELFARKHSNYKI